VNVDQLVEQAVERAGVSDFGPDGWREPLTILVASLTDEAGLSEFGLGVVAEQLIGLLVVRLQVEGCFAENPEIADQVIERPVFGLGLPRTGSTALSFLLALDDQHRSLRTWEAGSPVPPPEAATQHTDPRIAAAEDQIAFINEIFPDFRGMLPTSATGPQECLLLMALDFRSQMFEAQAKVPSYSQYLASCDMMPTYEYHKRVLQLLQWRCPPSSWWLKTPAHMQHIEELNAVYPDALFVMTHREVAKVIPSVCALMSALSSPMTDSPDPDYFGRLTSEQWEQSLRRLLAFRDADNEHRFYDIAFADFQTDPVATVAGLYAFLGEPLRPETAVLMDAWWADNSVDRVAAKPYKAADFGLDLDALQNQFSFYGERFGVGVAG
jgi:hypothetical protein